MADLPKCGTCKWAVKPDDVQMRLAKMRLCHGDVPVVLPIGKNSQGGLVTETHWRLVTEDMVGCRHHEVDIVS